jgi:exopolyphosphatase
MNPQVNDDVYALNDLTVYNLDLDSLTSSLLFAYIRSCAPPPNAFTPLYVPVTNIPASDVSIRPEFLALLPHGNIEASHLITLDDLPSVDQLEARLPPKNTRWILVDHNSLQGELGRIYSDKVAGTIDHHDDEHTVPKETGVEPRIILKSGSCTSLVVNYSRKSWDSLSLSAVSSDAASPQRGEIADDTSDKSLWDMQVAKLAMASILIDTHNLQAEDRTTNHDVDAVEFLTSKIMSSHASPKSFDRTVFFDQLSTAKRDIDSLSLSDILRKDYKEWTEDNIKLGISSVVKSTDFLVEKANKQDKQTDSKDVGPFLQVVNQFCQDRGLDVFVIMTTSTSANAEFQRELFVWALKADSVAVAKRFEKQASNELGLQTWTGASKGMENESKDQWRRIWQQHEVQHSRKRVAPLFREAMN